MKVLVLFYSTYGHVHRLAQAVAEEGERMPSENEIAAARFQGRHVAQIAKKLAA